MFELDCGLVWFPFEISAFHQLLSNSKYPLKCVGVPQTIALKLRELAQNV